MQFKMDVLSWIGLNQGTNYSLIVTNLICYKSNPLLVIFSLNKINSKQYNGNQIFLVRYII
jgi:hypothetical protein